MPRKYARRKPTRRPARKSRWGKKRMMRRAFNGVPDKASCSEKFAMQWSTGSGGALTQSIPFNVIFQRYNENLSFTTRAEKIAEGYQQYRFKRITYTFKPENTQFPPGSTVPMLYYLIDRGANASDYTTVNQFRDSGCRGIQMDKTIRISFRPGVLQATLDNQPANTMVNNRVLISPWLSTDQTPYTSAPWTASQVDHLGLAFVVENVSAQPLPVSYYKLEIEYEIEFRKPLASTATGLQLPVGTFDDDGLPVVKTVVEPVPLIE